MKSWINGNSFPAKFPVTFNLFSYIHNNLWSLELKPVILSSRVGRTKVEIKRSANSIKIFARINYTFQSSSISAETLLERSVIKSPLIHLMFHTFFIQRVERANSHFFNSIHSLSCSFIFFSTFLFLSVSHLKNSFIGTPHFPSSSSSNLLEE